MEPVYCEICGQATEFRTRDAARLIRHHHVLVDSIVRCLACINTIGRARFNPLNGRPLDTDVQELGTVILLKPIEIGRMEITADPRVSRMQPVGPLAAWHEEPFECIEEVADMAPPVRMDKQS